MRFKEIDGNYWCERCNDVVTAEQAYDRDTGYCEIRCSNCGYEDIEEVSNCPRCGDPLISTDDVICEICDNCIDDLDSAISEAIKRLQGQYTAPHIGYKDYRELILTRLKEIEGEYD